MNTKSPSFTPIGAGTVGVVLLVLFCHLNQIVF